MYRGWRVRERDLREYRGDGKGRDISFGNRAAICSAIDLEIVAFEGETFNEVPDGSGIDSEQLTPQHKRARLASCDFSLLLAFSQHFIIWLFGEWSGVPDAILPASEKRMKNNVNRFAT